MMPAMSYEPRASNFERGTSNFELRTPTQAHRTPNQELSKGFTVVELLAAMVVSSLVVALVVSTYLFSERIMARQRKAADLKSIVSGCTQRIIRDIESNSNLVQCGDTSLVLSRYSSPEIDSLDEVFYGFVGGHVTRNGVIVNDPQTELFARMSFVEDTISAHPVRLWNISVIGRNGSAGDSMTAYVSTMITSQELVDREMEQSTK